MITRSPQPMEGYGCTSYKCTTNPHFFVIKNCKDAEKVYPFQQSVYCRGITLLAAAMAEDAGVAARVR